MIDVHEYFVIARQASCGQGKSKDGLRPLRLLGDVANNTSADRQT